MPAMIINGQCPPWCTRDHAAEACGSTFYHAGTIGAVTLSERRGTVSPGWQDGGPEHLDVETALYRPDESAEPGWRPTVEIAWHSGGRYRLIGLTPDQAGALAELLAQAASLMSSQPPVRG
jgi:hypothetical protein